MLFLVRRNSQLRIVLYLAIFILFRDAMTPLGLWSFGRQGSFWIRLYRDPWFLVLFGVACFGLSLGVYFFDRENRPLFRWTCGNAFLGLIWGIGGAIFVVAPIPGAVYRHTPIEFREARSHGKTSGRSWSLAFSGTCWKNRFFEAMCTACWPGPCLPSRRAFHPVSYLLSVTYFLR